MGILPAGVSISSIYYKKRRKCHRKHTADYFDLYLYGGNAANRLLCLQAYVESDGLYAGRTLFGSGSNRSQCRRCRYERLAANGASGRHVFYWSERRLDRHRTLPWSVGELALRRTTAENLY